MSRAGGRGAGAKVGGGARRRSAQEGVNECVGVDECGGVRPRDIVREGWDCCVWMRMYDSVRSFSFLFVVRFLYVRVYVCLEMELYVCALVCDPKIPRKRLV